MHRAVPALACVAALVGAGVAVYVASAPSALEGVSYADLDAVREDLAGRGYEVSGATVISDRTAGSYCAYPGAAGLRDVPHCITTIVLDPSGAPLGNINMGGTPEAVAVALATLEGPAAGDPRISEVFDAVIDATVCECWEEEAPGGIASVAQWVVDAGRQHGAGQGALSSKIEGFEGRTLLLEAAPGEGQTVWTLVVYSP